MSTPISQLPTGLAAATHAAARMPTSPEDDPMIREALSYVNGAYPTPQAQGEAMHPSNASMAAHGGGSGMHVMQQQQQQQQQMMQGQAQAHAQAQAQAQAQAHAIQQHHYQQRQQQLHQQQQQQQDELAVLLSSTASAPAVPHAALPAKPASGPARTPPPPLLAPDLDDAHLAVMAAAFYVTVSLIPVSDLAARFAPFLKLDSIPFSDLLVRALLLAAALYAGRRLVTML